MSINLCVSVKCTRIIHLAGPHRRPPMAIFKLKRLIQWTYEIPNCTCELIWIITFEMRVYTV